MKRINSMVMGSLLLFTSMDAQERCEPIIKKKVNEVYGRVKQFIKKHKHKFIFCSGVVTGGTILYLLCCCTKKGYCSPSTTFDEVDENNQKLNCHDFHPTPQDDEGKDSNDASKAGRRWYFGN